MSQTNLRIFENIQKLNGISAQRFIELCLDGQVCDTLRELPLRDDLTDVTDFKLTYNGVKIIVSNRRIWEYVKTDKYCSILRFTTYYKDGCDDMVVGLKTPVGWIHNGVNGLLPTNIPYNEIIRNLPENAVCKYYNVFDSLFTPIERETITHMFPADFPASGVIMISTETIGKYCDKKFIGKEKIDLPIKNVSDKVIKAVEEIMGDDWRQNPLTDISDILTYLDILVFLGIKPDL